MGNIYESLVDIVGGQYVSNQQEERYFYARDPGLMMPHEPDYIVMPKTAEEVRKIVQLANEEKLPLVPRGGGLALTGLVIPLKGGIVIDMKRMGKILEVNEEARYVVCEGGVTEGTLKAYLQRHHPNLRHSIPDAPPIATIAGNAVIHGQGRLAQQYGLNSDMICGLEVVLPTGKICRIGSYSMSPYWFSKSAPLPDLSGLFLGWLGTTGIVTKLGIKLYPCKKLRDVEIFVVDKEDLVPDILFRLTHTEMVEDLTVWSQPYPLMFQGNHHITMFLTADSDEELEFKRKMVWDVLQDYIDCRDGGFMSLTPDAKETFLEMPQKSAAASADVRKGGGFEYSGPTILVEKYPECARKAAELSSKYELSYSASGRVVGRSHCMMFFFSYFFNRADPAEMDRVRKALHEAVEFAIGEGGIPWKPSVDEQKMAMERMDPNTLILMKRIKELLDPNEIMNPGNWEVL